MHFQLKNTTFSYASPLDPRIIFLFSEANVTMCIGIFHTYTTVIWMHCGIEQIVSTMHLFCPLFNLIMH